jgi:hypothetical protein
MGCGSNGGSPSLCGIRMKVLAVTLVDGVMILVEEVPEHASNAETSAKTKNSRPITMPLLRM